MSKKSIPHVLREADLLARFSAAIGAHKSAESDIAARMRAEREIGLILIEAQRRKDAWISSARKEFSAGHREACMVCGKFRSVAHAHHVVPLSVQYDRGFDRPDHDYVWLCPNHHAIVHVLLYPYDDAQQRGKAAASVIVEIADNEAEYHAVMNLLGRAGREE